MAASSPGARGAASWRALLVLAGVALLAFAAHLGRSGGDCGGLLGLGAGACPPAQEVASGAAGAAASASPAAPPGAGAAPEADDDAGGDTASAFAAALVGSGAGAPDTSTAQTTTAAPSTTTVTTRPDAAAPAVVERPPIFDVWAKGNKWFDRVAAIQQDCSLATDDIEVKHGGGFASKFQLVAGKVGKSYREGHAVRLVGHLGGYSEIEPCRKALGETFKKVGSFSCFFLPERPCKPGAGTPPAAREASREALEAFKRLKQGDQNESDAFHAMEAWMFRPNEDTVRNLAAREQRVGFDDRQQTFLIGIHARRGDKVVDPYNRYYTGREYAETVVNWASTAEPCKGPAAKVDVYIASDSATVKGEVRAFLERTPAASCSFRVIGMDDSVSQQASDAHRFDRPGEIQGMAGKVGQMKGAEAKEATLDILFDIYMLSRADLLIGTLTSQIGRTAAGLRKVVGFRPRYFSPLAMDYRNWQSVQGMGQGDGIPSPLGEGWVKTPRVEVSLGDSSFAERSELLGLICALQADTSREAHEVRLPEEGELAEVLLGAAELAAKELRKGAPVRFAGHLGGYSKFQLCRDIVGAEDYDKVGSFPCYFERERVCLPTAAAKSAAAGDVAGALERALAGKSETQLQDAFLAYMLRPTQETVAEFMKRSWIARIAELSGPLIGLQLFGDKASHRPDAAPSVKAAAEAVRRWAGARPQGEAEPCTVYVASDTDDALKALRPLLSGKKEGRCTFEVAGLMEYWAHHHRADGWPGRLTNVEGRWATRDLLFDVETLSRADALLASPASPLARAAARLRAVLWPELPPPMALGPGTAPGWTAQPGA